tara:strand:- start:29 stop:196 length:168 start_codon:yes stop_codon:yes gene_type:complete
MCGRAELYAPNLEQGWLENGRITPAVAVVDSGNLLILLAKLGLLRAAFFGVTNPK